jgi:hypothetical protein
MLSAHHDFQRLVRHIESVVEDRGNGAGLNRVLFAREHWDRSGKATHHTVLNGFSVVYLRLRQSPSIDIGQVRKIVEGVEAKVKDQLQPICNSETKWSTARRSLAIKEEFVCITRTLLSKDTVRHPAP